MPYNLNVDEVRAALPELAFTSSFPMAHGGQATTFRVSRSSENCVLKVYHPTVEIERAESEIEKLRGIDSPFVAKLLDTGVLHLRTGEHQYVLLAEIAGSSLRTLIDRRQLPEPHEVGSLLRCGLKAIDALWGYGRTVHRDITPNNIIRSDDRTFTLIDFGMAKKPGDASVTGAMRVVGTLGYIAPERMDHPKRPETNAGDLFSLGVTAYEYAVALHPYRCNQDLISSPTYVPTPIQRQVVAPKLLTDGLMNLLARNTMIRLAARRSLMSFLEQ